MRSYNDLASGITESDRFSINTFSGKENSKFLQLKQRKMFLEKLLNEKNQLLVAICKEVGFCVKCFIFVLNAFFFCFRRKNC